MSEASQLWMRVCSPEPERIPLRAFVFVAHPDDETIGASVAMLRFEEVHIVYLTDGAPHDPRFRSPDFQGCSRESYAEARRIEALCALGWAGISANQVISLGAPDQEAIQQVARLTGDFTDLIMSIRPDVVVTHPYEGGHPDHDAAALVAALTIAQVAREHPVLLEMTSYHAGEGGVVTGEYLPGRSELPGCDIFLSAEQKARKQRMIAAYQSQSAVLQSFSTERESLRVAPAYDFSQPPHAGRLWYEQLGWPLSGQQWRELAGSAIAAVRVAA